LFLQFVLDSDSWLLTPDSWLLAPDSSYTNDAITSPKVENFAT
jgi:hypothetical protein